MGKQARHCRANGLLPLSLRSCAALLSLPEEGEGFRSGAGCEDRGDASAFGHSDIALFESDLTDAHALAQPRASGAQDI